jgi:hypothetical protein
LPNKLTSPPYYVAYYPLKCSGNTLAFLQNACKNKWFQPADYIDILRMADEVGMKYYHVSFLLVRFYDHLCPSGCMFVFLGSGMAVSS